VTPPLLRVSEVAELLQVTEAFVYRHAGELGAFKVGRHLRFKTGDIDEWLKSRRLDEPSWEIEPFPSRARPVPPGWMSQPRSMKNQGLNGRNSKKRAGGRQ
jgi:excisionase family DNA binding protein